METNTKTCRLCKKEYDHGQRKGRDSICTPCQKVYDKERRGKHTQEYKDRQMELHRQRKLKIKQEVIDYLKVNPCSCGERRIEALQFDHRDRQTKAMGVTAMMSKGRTLKRIFEEIDKCDVLCGNCHAMRTADQMDWYKGIDEELWK